MNQQRTLMTVVAMWTLIQFGSIDAALAAAPEPSTLFKTKCSSCHTFGKGDHVGPDLKGVTQRHSREWLIAWIRSSETQIRRGDPAAEALFRKYRQQRMPDHDLSDAQIAALLDYLHAGGPAADEQQQLRLAVDATPQDVQLGSKLFFGSARLAGGAVACVFCHKLSKQTLLGGSLARDLTDAYTRYLDWALDQKLKRPCLSGATDPNIARVVEAESLALRAFLRSLSKDFIPTLINDQRSVGIRTPSSR
jgi:mono/diheme cytochrome c family protein